MSTGTNRERLEQNNTLLEDIKTQIQNLPEAGGGTVEGVKQFSTIEEMQADTTAKEGDLAVVYRSEVQNATVDSHFQTATFPDTVVLDTAITDYVEVRYRAVDNSVMFDCMGQLDSSGFNMDCYSETGEIRIQYESSDGITYTRTDGTGNPVDFGTEIYYEMAEMWNDAIGKFIQVGGNTFEGLYECSLYALDGKYQKLIDINTKTAISTPYLLPEFTTYERVNTANGDNACSMYSEMILSVQKSHISDDGRWNVIDKCQVYQTYGGYLGLIENNNIFYVQITAYNGDYDSAILVEDYDFSLENPVVSSKILYNSKTNTDYSDYVVIGTIPGSLSSTYYGKQLEGEAILRIDQSSYIHYDEIGVSSPKTTIIRVEDAGKCNIFAHKYQIAKNQLTALTGNVYNSVFYGKNGVETGTLQNKENLTKDEVKHRVDIWSNYNSGIVCPSDISSMFMDCSSLTTIPELDTSSVTNMQYMFYGCTNLTTIPLLDTSNVTTMYCMFHRCSSLTTIPLLDTHNVTTMYDMFYGCTSLTTIPELDTSSVTTMFHVFDKCTSLTTIPLLDTSKVTSMSSMFQDCTNLTTIPLLNTSSVDNIAGMFYGCTNLTEIPSLDTSSVTVMGNMFANCTNLTEIPLLDTSKVTSMYGIFNNCSSLTTIPSLNTSKVDDMQRMFTGCTSLSDESLNNILAMCKNAVKITSNKTLKYIGLTETQANKCKTLSNYSAFTSAGWTTGY